MEGSGQGSLPLAENHVPHCGWLHWLQTRAWAATSDDDHQCWQVFQIEANTKGI